MKKKPAPKKPVRKPTMNVQHRLLRDEINRLMQQSAQDMAEIGTLNKRVRLIEEVNRGIYARLNALESRQPVDTAPVKSELVRLQGILGSMQASMPTVFLADWEVRKLRKIIAAMA